MKQDTILVPDIDPSRLDGVVDIASVIDDLGTRNTIDCLNWNEYPYHPLTTFSLMRSGENLYVDFFVRCNYLRAFYDKVNSPVYEDSCVAIILQPSAVSEHYYVFEFNCIGTVRGLICGTDGSCNLMPPEALEQIERSVSAGIRPFRELEGLFSWNVAVKLPLSLIGVDIDGTSPVELKGNFYKCASGTSQPHFLSWQPIKSDSPDFLQPESFGTIILE